MANRKISLLDINWMARRLRIMTTSVSLLRSWWLLPAKALWDTLADYGTDVYFGDTIRMLCMISVTGNWLVPETATDSTKGDLDGDGTITVSDLVLLNRYLLRLESLTTEQGNRADWNDDQQITVVDAMLMRRSLL